MQGKEAGKSNNIFPSLSQKKRKGLKSGMTFLKFQSSQAAEACSAEKL